MSTAGLDNAVSIGAAQRVRVNIEDISATLKKQESDLKALTATPVLSGEPLQKIQGIVRDTGERIAILRRTGLVRGQNEELLNGLSDVQNELMTRVAKGDQRLGLLSQSLREQSRMFLHLSASDVPHSGTALRNMHSQLRDVRKEVDVLRQALPLLNPEDDHTVTLGQLDAIQTNQERQLVPVQQRINAVNGVSCFSVPGRDELRVPFDVHSRIGAFLGSEYRVCNTRSRDDIRNPRPAPKPERNIFEFVVLDSPQNREACAAAFDALTIDEAEITAHYLWILHGRTNPTRFNAREKALDSPQAALRYSLAARMVVNLQVAMRGIDVSKCGVEERSQRVDRFKKDHWDSMFVGSPTQAEAADLAQTLLMEAVWIARGCTNDRGELAPQLSVCFESTTGMLDTAAQIACYRLSRNRKLSLLETHNERDAIRQFSLALRPLENRTKENLRQAFDILKVSSTKAAKFFSSIVGYGILQDPKKGEDCIRTTEAPEQIKHICAIARALSTFENGPEPEAFIIMAAGDVEH